MEMNQNQNGYHFTEEKPESKKDHRFIKGALFGALLVFVLGSVCLGTGILHFGNRTETAGTEQANQEEEKQIVTSETETKLQLIRNLAEKYYLYDVDEEELQEGICAGFVSALDDPYTAYYDKEQTKELLESVTGVYSGVGAVLLQDAATRQVQILSVYKDSPAEKAGLQEGDILISIDGRELAGEDVSEIVTWIRGEEGTEVTIGVIRGEKKEKVELTAVRAKIEMQTVEYEMKENHIGYLQILEFDDVTLNQFNQAMEDLRNQGMERLIVDLRSNPGGNVDTVCDILRSILPEGMIVYTENKDGKRTEYKNEEDHTLDLPMVVLVNEYSASASEIFTGAVQDYGIGTIVGTTTYGKGVVQQLIDLKDGTYLKLTVSEYFTPKGRSIHEKGIEPDVVVEYQVDEQNPDADNQLEKAIEVVSGM